MRSFQSQILSLLQVLHASEHAFIRLLYSDVLQDSGPCDYTNHSMIIRSRNLRSFWSWYFVLAARSVNIEGWAITQDLPWDRRVSSDRASHRRDSQHRTGCEWRITQYSQAVQRLVKEDGEGKRWAEIEGKTVNETIRKYRRGKE